MTSREAFEQRVRRLVGDLGIADPGDIVGIHPLAGGVASDIAMVDLGGRRICVKFALEKLKVAAEWRAPVRRNRAEYAWLAFAATVVPEAVPKLFGWSAAENGFAMDYLDGLEIVLWKTALLAGTPPNGEAAAVGRLIGRIHAASAAPGFDAAPFANAEDFRALRLEPYLGFTASRHPELADRLGKLAARLDAARAVLVHGDVSPKNILMRAGQPVLLDAECATMGDASFDIAFCLNHLVLKAVHVPPIRSELLGSVLQFWQAYAAEAHFGDVALLEGRVAELLPALMLARIDGKSPVEYLGDDERRFVRALAIRLLAVPPPRLAALIDIVTRDLLDHG